jgi:hypothetical protein
LIAQFFASVTIDPPPPPFYTNVKTSNEIRDTVGEKKKSCVPTACELSSKVVQQTHHPPKKKEKEKKKRLAFD